MFEYLQTSDGQIVSGIVIAAIIFSAIILFSIKVERKARPVRTLEEANSAPWYAHEYKAFLISKIKAACTTEQLMAEMILIDRYPLKQFRQPISRFTINKYYIEILDAYAAKEDELTFKDIELCKN